MMTKILILSLFVSVSANASVKSNDMIHKWAQKIVFATFPDDKGGSYDICMVNDETMNGRENIGDPDWLDVQNACAIITHGAEW